MNSFDIGLLGVLLENVIYHFLETQVLCIGITLVRIAKYIPTIVVQAISCNCTCTPNMFLDKKLLSLFLIITSVFESEESSVFINNDDKCYLFPFATIDRHVFASLIVII